MTTLSELMAKLPALLAAAEKALANWTDTDGGDSWEQRDYRHALASFGNDPQTILALGSALSALYECYRAAKRVDDNVWEFDGRVAEEYATLLRAAIEKVEAIGSREEVER